MHLILKGLKLKKKLLLALKYAIYSKSAPKFWRLNSAETDDYYF